MQRCCDIFFIGPRPKKVKEGLPDTLLWQLYSLGLIAEPIVPFDCDAVNMLTELYHEHGDTIALQYGGSHLVNTMETYRKINQWTSQSRDMFESIKRFYSNSFVGMPP